MGLQINKIHHVAIISDDYLKSKHFYVDILGCKVVCEIYRAERQSYKLDLELSGTYCIELFSFPNPPQRLSLPEAAGLRHLAFEVDSVEEAVQYLQEHDVSVEDIRVDPTTGKKYTFFSDPDNLPLELYAK